MRSIIYVDVCREESRHRLQHWLYGYHIQDSISNFGPYVFAHVPISWEEDFKGKGCMACDDPSYRWQKELAYFIPPNPEKLLYNIPVPRPMQGTTEDCVVDDRGCIAMDLYGQVCSETAGARQISGTGGQLDFVTGAYMSEFGKAFLAMASTFTDRQGTVHSRILPKFTQGDVITTPRTQAPYMVTEYGAACLSGLPTWQRAEKIISIAHPDFREGLIRAAEGQKIWRKSNQR